MLKQKYVKSRKVCKITFEIPTTELPSEVTPEEVCVVGDFNDWNAEATPMKRIKSTGAFKAEVDLEPEKSYEFRYLVNTDFWLNDPEATGYVPNEFGTKNSVIETAAYA